MLLVRPLQGPPLLEIRALLREAPVLTFSARAGELHAAIDGEWSRSALLDALRAHLHEGDGSCLPDLVGARVLPGFDPARLRARIRFPARWLWETARMAPLRPRPVRGAGLGELMDAAAAAVGGGPEARVVLAHAAVRAGHRQEPIAAACRATTRTVRRWLREEVSERQLAAVRYQLSVPR